ncbi:MAG: hypothetical protein KJ077_10955 [Anaerolineae bacterium]|nr:hypothetical protein [Anaerolineae bacterium]
MYVISTEDIEQIFRQAENESRDMSPEIREGDWVTLVGDYGEAYRQGHVLKVYDDGSLRVAFGGRETPRYMWLLFAGETPIPAGHVQQVWRKFDCVLRSEFNGCKVRSLETEWVQVR